LTNIKIIIKSKFWFDFAGGGANGVLNDDTSHTWVDKCYKNDEECLEVIFGR